MRRLEDILHDLAEQDQPISTDDLIARIEQGLSGETEPSLVAMPGRHMMESSSDDLHPQEPRRWSPVTVAAGVAALLILLVGLPLLLLRGGESTVADEPTTTEAPVTTTTPDALPATGVTFAAATWDRFGANIMDPVVGLFDMAEVGKRLVAVGFDPGVLDFRQNGVVFVSEDGVNWERLAESDQALTEGAVLIYGISEGGPGLVAVGMGCEDDTQPCPAYPTVWTSVDGTSWTRSGADPAVFTNSGAMLDVVAIEDGVVAAGSVGEVLGDETYVWRPGAWFSADGLVWSPAWTGEQIDSGESLFLPGFVALAAGPDQEVVGVGMAESSGGNLVAAVWHSPDGRTWERIDADSPAFTGVDGRDVTMQNIAWTSNGYIAVGSEGGIAARVWLSPDGRNWSLLDTGSSLGGVGTLSSVAAAGSGYVAAGPHGWTDQTESVITLWTSPDGQEWDPVLDAGPGYASEIVSNDSGIAVAGAFPSDFNLHAGIWVGPTVDPLNPPATPETVTFAIPTGGEGDGAGSTVDPTTVAGTDVWPGDPFVEPPADYEIDDGTTRLPLGERTDIPTSYRWDFLASMCDNTGCYREPVVVDSVEDGGATSAWPADEPFHIRHGFVTENSEPLSDAFDLEVFVTRREGPDLAGSYELGESYRSTTDYVLQVTTSKCGPGYWEQTEEAPCEQFVHEFPDGLPPGRYDIWVGWSAPCSAWENLGLVDTCNDPEEVSVNFSSAVNSPVMSMEYSEGEDVVSLDPESFLDESYAEEFTWGW